MSTNARDSEDCIGSEDSCELCGTPNPARFAMPGDRPSVYVCLHCAPAGGEHPRRWFDQHFSREGQR